MANYVGGQSNSGGFENFTQQAQINKQANEAYNASLQAKRDQQLAQYAMQQQAQNLEAQKQMHGDTLAQQAANFDLMYGHNSMGKLGIANVNANAREGSANILADSRMYGADQRNDASKYGVNIKYGIPIDQDGNALQGGSMGMISGGTGGTAGTGGTRSPLGQRGVVDDGPDTSAISALIKAGIENRIPVEQLDNYIQKYNQYATKPPPVDILHNGSQTNQTPSEQIQRQTTFPGDLTNDQMAGYANSMAENATRANNYNKFGDRFHGDTNHPSMALDNIRRGVDGDQIAQFKMEDGTPFFTNSGAMRQEAMIPGKNNYLNNQNDQVSHGIDTNVGINLDNQKNVGVIPDELNVFGYPSAYKAKPAGINPSPGIDRNVGINLDNNTAINPYNFVPTIQPGQSPPTDAFGQILPYHQQPNSGNTKPAQQPHVLSDMYGTNVFGYPTSEYKVKPAGINPSVSPIPPLSPAIQAANSAITNPQAYPSSFYGNQPQYNPVQAQNYFNPSDYNSEAAYLNPSRQSYNNYANIPEILSGMQMQQIMKNRLKQGRRMQ